ncbi:MAG: hypothetical protein LUI39_11905 [Lachnospiraceae bacterium]|nr:hypothetical protein [Lachnospiraceae bacterium]
MEVFRKGGAEAGTRRNLRKINNRHTPYVNAERNRSDTYLTLTGRYQPGRNVSSQRYECFERFGTTR